jgi:hypothetical protein
MIDASTLRAFLDRPDADVGEWLLRPGNAP